MSLYNYTQSTTSWCCKMWTVHVCSYICNLYPIHDQRTLLIHAWTEVPLTEVHGQIMSIIDQKHYNCMLVIPLPMFIVIDQCGYL